KTVTTGGGDKQIRPWDPNADNSRQRRSFGTFGGPVLRLQYTPDGKQLVACSSDKTLRVINATSGSQVHSLKGHQDWIYSVAISPDGKTVASGSWDGEVRLWNLADGKALRTILAAPGLSPKPPANAQAASR